MLGRALAALPAPARAGKIRLRADAGYFAGQLARAALSLLNEVLAYLRALPTPS